MSLRLSALDIQQKTFSRKKLGGIDEEEVREFLKEMAREFEVMTADGKTSRDQLAILRQRLSEYGEMEKTLKATLVSAQKTSGELRQNAEKEAELIVRNAELSAERIVDEARKEVRELSDEIRMLKKGRRKLRIELKNVLDGFYDLINEEIPEGKPATRVPGEAAAAADGSK